MGFVVFAAIMQDIHHTVRVNARNKTVYSSQKEFVTTFSTKCIQLQVVIKDCTPPEFTQKSTVFSLWQALIIMLSECSIFKDGVLPRKATPWAPGDSAPITGAHLCTDSSLKDNIRLAALVHRHMMAEKCELNISATLLHNLKCHNKHSELLSLCPIHIGSSLSKSKLTRAERKPAARSFT